MKKILVVFFCILLLNILLTSRTYAFSPSDIQGLAAWYKPESIQLNNNDPIFSWPDSSGNGYTLQQTTPSQQPFYYSTYGINGLPTVRFEGVQELKLNGNLCGSLSDQATLLVVTRPLNDETYNIVDTNPSSDTWWRFEDLTGYLGVFRPDRVSRIALMPNSGAHIFALVSGIDYSFYIDRDHQNTVAGNFSCGDVFAIGGISGGKTLIGDISEVIVYNSALSDTDRTNVEDYLYSKYFVIPQTPTPTPTPTSTPVPPSFLPSDVSGLTAWFKPESLQLNNNDTVSSWTDSSGNGFALQQLTSSAQPIYTVTGINGLSTVSFNGQHELKVNTNLCSMITDQATLFIVTRILDDIQYSIVDTNPDTDSYWRDNIFGLSYLGVFRLNRVARFVYPMPTSGVHIFTLKSGTHYSFYTDRVHQSTVDGNFSCGTMFGIGGVSGGKPLIGDISEVIVYNSVVSDTDRVNVENYLYGKYFILNTPSSVSAIPNETIVEGNTYAFSGSFTDPNSTSWTAIVDYGDGSGVQRLGLSGKNFNLSHVYKDSGIYTVTVSVTDNQGATGNATARITVNNVAPSLSAITAPTDPQLVNTVVTASSNFTDPGVLDTHTAVWDWGNGMTTNGSVTETNGSGSVTDTHTYTSAGVYTITLTVTDKDGGQGTQTFQYLSIYNPTSQGLFSAGQKYTSLAGAYIQNPGLTGNVLFGLSYKYQGTIPTGNRQFTMDFNSANFHFNATSISSLVISSGIGTLRGTGTVNGSGTYNFLVTGNEANDTIRIQIKDQSGLVIYDTQPGASDTANPTTFVTAGKVLAH